MMGPHYGMGPGFGSGWRRAAPARDLSADDVRKMFEARLAWRGNPNLKLGEVKERDEDTIVADVVTKDDSLVQRYQVDRHTGFMRPVY